MLNKKLSARRATRSFGFDAASCMAPLPRAYSGKAHLPLRSPYALARTIVGLGIKSTKLQGEDLLESRKSTLEIIADGVASTTFMLFGDAIRDQWDQEAGRGGEVSLRRDQISVEQAEPISASAFLQNITPLMRLTYHDWCTCFRKDNV